jgi:hypothetical protein
MQGEVQVEVERDDLISQLHQLINSNLEKFPLVSLNGLATRSNIPVSTLRRISLGKKKSDIAPHTVLNLTSYLLKEKNLTELLKKVDPVIKGYLEKILDSSFCPLSKEFMMLILIVTSKISIVTSFTN